MRRETEQPKASALLSREKTDLKVKLVALGYPSMQTARQTTTAFADKAAGGAQKNPSHFGRRGASKPRSHSYPQETHQPLRLLLSLTSDTREHSHVHSLHTHTCTMLVVSWKDKVYAVIVL